MSPDTRKSIERAPSPAVVPDCLVAGSDPELRKRLAESLRRQPGTGRIHEAEDRAGLERTLTKLTPAVLLLDLPMRGFDGLESLETIRTLSPTTETIVLVDSPDDQAAVRALRAGAKGYCSRTTDSALLTRAVQLVRQGEIWVGRKVMLHLIEELAALHHEREGKADDWLRLLTNRERQVSGLIALGASNKEIASRLGITEKTVKAHLTSIFQKLGISSRLQLAIYGLDEGSRVPINVEETRVRETVASRAG